HGVVAVNEAAHRAADVGTQEFAWAGEPGRTLEQPEEIVAPFAGDGVPRCWLGRASGNRAKLDPVTKHSHADPPGWQRRRLQQPTRAARRRDDCSSRTARRESVTVGRRA